MSAALSAWAAVPVSALSQCESGITCTLRGIRADVNSDSVTALLSTVVQGLSDPNHCDAAVRILRCLLPVCPLEALVQNDTTILSSLQRRFLSFTKKRSESDEYANVEAALAAATFFARVRYLTQSLQSVEAEKAQQLLSRSLSQFLVPLVESIQAGIRAHTNDVHLMEALVVTTSTLIRATRRLMQPVAPTMITCLLQGVFDSNMPKVAGMLASALAAAVAQTRSRPRNEQHASEHAKYLRAALSDMTSVIRQLRVCADAEEPSTVEFELCKLANRENTKKASVKTLVEHWRASARVARALLDAKQLAMSALESRDVEWQVMLPLKYLVELGTETLSLQVTKQQLQVAQNAGKTGDVSAFLVLETASALPQMRRDVLLLWRRSALLCGTRIAVSAHEMLEYLASFTNSGTCVEDKVMAAVFDTASALVRNCGVGLVRTCAPQSDRLLLHACTLVETHVARAMTWQVTDMSDQLGQGGMMSMPMDSAASRKRGSRGKRADKVARHVSAVSALAMARNNITQPSALMSMLSQLVPSALDYMTAILSVAGDVVAADKRARVERLLAHVSLSMRTADGRDIALLPTKCRIALVDALAASVACPTKLLAQPPLVPLASSLLSNATRDGDQQVRKAAARAASSVAALQQTRAPAPSLGVHTEYTVASQETEVEKSFGSSDSDIDKCVDDAVDEIVSAADLVVDTAPVVSHEETVETPAPVPVAPQSPVLQQSPLQQQQSPVLQPVLVPQPVQQHQSEEVTVAPAIAAIQPVAVESMKMQSDSEDDEDDFGLVDAPPDQ
ncbi:MAG: hypothetical protein MHM6MM_007181 [Cercozoa sp. M6MM]